MIALLFLLAVSPPTQGSCTSVEGERIYARDLVQVLPQFASVPADLVLGYAPAPGIRRILTGPSLQAIAKRQGVELELTGDVCVELRMEKLTREDIHAAMAGAEDPGRRITVTAWGPETAPLGKLVFPHDTLQIPADKDPNNDALWRGYVSYGANRRYSVWARARIAIPTTRIVALTDIAPGTPIRADQVRVEQTETAAQDDRVARSLEQVVGLASRSPVREGAALTRIQLTRLPEVAKGDIVTVHVTDGGTQLIFPAEAQSAGAIGSMVWMKNPVSGKAFRAKVTGTGTVAVGLRRQE